MLACTKVAQAHSEERAHPPEKLRKEKATMKAITQLQPSGADPLIMKESEQTIRNLCKGICMHMSKIARENFFAHL